MIGFVATALADFWGLLNFGGLACRWFWFCLFVSSTGDSGFECS